MSRTFKTVNYEQALDLTVRLGDCLPPEQAEYEATLAQRAERERTTGRR